MDNLQTTFSSNSRSPSSFSSPMEREYDLKGHLRSSLTNFRSFLGHRGDWEWSSRDHFGPRKRFWIKTANFRSNLWINFRKQMVILSEKVNALKILRWNFNTVLRLGDLVRYGLSWIGFWDNNRLADSLDAGVSLIWPMNAFKFKLSLLLIKKIEVVFVVVNLVCIFGSFYGFSLISTFIFLDFEFWNGPRSKSNHGRHGLNHGKNSTTVKLSLSSTKDQFGLIRYLWWFCI